MLAPVFLQKKLQLFLDIIITFVVTYILIQIFVIEKHEIMWYYVYSIRYRIILIINIILFHNI